jgi:hypothetical protein
MSTPVSIPGFIAESNLRGINISLNAAGDEMEFRDCRLKHPVWGVNGGLSGHWRTRPLTSFPIEFQAYVTTNRAASLEFLSPPSELDEARLKLQEAHKKAGRGKPRSE